MTSTGTPAPPSPLPFWKIWANPIFRRYCRSRLRPRGLGISLLITLIIAAFLFFIFRSTAMYRADMDLVDAERAAILPLLFFQCLILFLAGTGQVAAGMTAEADEGVIDYQRLAPMTPLSKVLGYLFGLPVREYVCVIATLPFTAWALWRGQVDLRVALPLYLVFFSSTILYHVTGLVAGTVLKNRRWAFLLSMGMVFFLYTIMPYVSNFGLAYFRYLTIYPVLQDSMGHLLTRDMGAALLAGQALLGKISFFNIDLPEFVFTILSQGILIFTLIIMLWRRWRRNESHLLGKAWATGFFVWIQLTLLGNALPRIESGLIFPSREFTRGFFRLNPNTIWEPQPLEAVAMAGAVGFVSLAILWTVTAMITPNAATQLRGWRRARKLGKTSLPLNSDPATAFPWVAIMAACGAAGWFLFTQAVVESRWFPGAEMPHTALGAFALVFFAGGLGFHALLESKGGRITALAAILVGVVPILIGAVLGTITDRFAVPAIWITAFSPATGTSYASLSIFPLTELPVDLALGVTRAVPRAFWFCQGLAALIALYLITTLRQSRKQIAQSARTPTSDS
jgi:hypothetical protein